ncbi:MULTISPECIES: biopolymer transporter ExbD [Trichocoleus]|uniref:Biopolymer transporter ExbD n=2 Tax=Trichocoleus TaxID=450526 RepID=A0ABV0JEJ4_9CYAN|nr:MULTISPECIES: biopolymer transporter ExbD [unclassified Trichocoleus]MBD1862387.1 biopolymer transporter ExbD [Trichocoleus sp. FACHB-46]MBD2096107.1 biopolymer transporter ExbD [Trichocoleus sp. FACHB-591]MBD2123510.1 biopolymer transporter ExbD [Trichocoleus sp. FACHB-262]
MRFKSRQNRAEMPELNLLPMMDVIMTVLTFFIIVSMTLTNQKTVNITLPSANTSTELQNTPDPLVVGLNRQGQVLLADQPTNEAALAQQMQAYLVQNPKGAVILKADSKLPYEQVVKLLATMRDVGGDRVSLAVDES